MGCRANRNIILRNINADAQTLRIDVREVMLGLFRILMGHVETNMVKTVNLHLFIDGTSHDVTRGKAQALIIFLHETLAVRQTENTAVATHGLCDEECRMSFSRMKESSRVELYKLHVGYCSLGTIDHRLAIACGNDWVGSGLIDRTATTGTHHSYLAEISIYFLSIRIEDVGSITVDVRSAASDACA